MQWDFLFCQFLETIEQSMVGHFASPRKVLSRAISERNMMTDSQPRAGKRILVVDDNPVILKALFSFLVSKGYEVIIALDGAEVLTCVRQQRPDLILLDIFFPPYVEGGVIWDGFLILKWLRGQGNAADIPVFIISGGEPEKYKDRCLAAGARAYFKKPIPFDDLAVNIRSTFEAPVSTEPTGPSSGLAADIA